MISQQTGPQVLLTGKQVFLAETVTFGTSGLDRAAHLRGDAAQIAALLQEPTAGMVPLWRGKPLLQSDGTGDGRRLVWLSVGHPALDQAGPPLFLGLDGVGPRFAVDLSGWEPDHLPDGLDAFLDASEQHHPALSDSQKFAELRGVMTTLSVRDAEFAATARAVLGWHQSHRFCARCGTESQVAMAGWQRDCPACSAKHFPRTDPVVIMLITHGNDVLIGRSPGWPDRMYSLLAGFVEPGETIEAAVRREVAEEAGVTVGPVRYLTSQPWPFPASLMIGCQGVATSRDITIDPSEIEAAQWVSREDMAQVFTGTHPDIAPARKGAVAHFLLSHWLSDTLGAARIS